MERFTRLLQERTTRIEQRIAAALEPVGMSAGEGARAPGPVITIGEWIAALSDDLASSKLPGTHDAARQLGLREAKRFFQRDIPASQFMSASEQVRRACLDLAAEGGLSSSENGVTSGLWAFFARLKSSFFEESQRLWAKDAGTMTPPAAPDGALPQGAAVAVGAALPLDADLMTAALQAAANAVVITDGEGTIRWVNSAFARLTQYSIYEAIGKNPRILKSGAQDEAVYRNLWTTITAGGVWKGELVNKRKDGTLYTEEMTITPVRDEAGMVNHFIAVKEDISLRKATETALKANEEHYRLLIENQGEGIGIVDMEEKFIFCNPAADVIFGMQPGGLLGRKVTEFLDSSQAEVVRRQSTARRKREKTTYELDIVLGNGERRCLLMTAVPRTDEEGNAAGTFGVFRDISARKRAEEEVRYNANLLHNIIDSSADFIFVKDKELKTIICNDRYAGALAKSPSDLYGKTDIENGWDPALVKGDPSKGIRGFECDDREALAGASIHNGNDPANVNGETRIFDTIKLPLRDPEGEIIGVLGISRDVTNNKRAEKELQDSEARYRVLFQASADGILIADIETKHFKYANPVMCDLLGYSEKELTRLGPADIHPPEDLQRLMAQFNDEARGEQFFASDTPCLRRDGTIFHAEIHSTCIDILGKPHLVGLFRDVSERKRNEDQIKKHLEELHRWQGIMLDREDRIQELKREVNALSCSQGKPIPYPSQEFSPDSVMSVS